MKTLPTLLAALLLFSGHGLAAQAPGAPPADPWAGLRFLLGTWEAKTTGGAAQAESSGTYAFQLELHDQVLARHSANGACKGPSDFDCLHRDLLYIYVERGTLQAIYFDNEGHVIHYVVSTPSPGIAVFLSDPAQPGPQFQLTYTLADGVMTGKFQMRFPGQTAFKSYLEWSGKRQ